MEEIIDLYDKHLQKLNKTWIRGKTLPKDCYRRVVHIYILNSKGEMLIQKRVKTKSVFADLWDISVGGGVTFGDTLEQSATRELKEELGYDYDFSFDRPVLTIHHDEGFDDYFIIHKNLNIEDLVLQESEVAKVKWANKTEILSMLEKHEFIPYKNSIIELLFDMSKQIGALNL